MLIVISSRSFVGGSTTIQPHPGDNGGIGVGRAKLLLLMSLLAVIIAMVVLEPDVQYSGSLPAVPANGAGEEADESVSPVLEFVLWLLLLLLPPVPSIAVTSDDGCFELPSIVTLR